MADVTLSPTLFESQRPGLTPPFFASEHARNLEIQRDPVVDNVVLVRHVPVLGETTNCVEGMIHYGKSHRRVVEYLFNFIAHGGCVWDRILEFIGGFRSTELGARTALAMAYWRSRSVQSPLYGPRLQTRTGSRASWKSLVT